MILTPKINTIIIEDNPQASNYLEKILLKQFSCINIIGYANSIDESILLINNKKPELIFMDIELTDGYSFEIFNKLTHQEFEVIFVTAYGDFIQQALDYYAFSFITKPIELDKLIEAVNHYLNLKKRIYSKYKHDLLMEFLDSSTSKILLHIGDEHISVKLSDIIKIEAQGNYTYFFLANKSKLLVSKPFGHFESLLIPKGFFKAHRSIIVNLNWIKSIYRKETIVLSNGERVHVSARNKSKLTDLIQILS